MKNFNKFVHTIFLDKGLDFAHFPLNLQIPRIRVEFEYRYRQICSYLTASNRLLFKTNDVVQQIYR